VWGTPVMRPQSPYFNELSGEVVAGLRAMRAFPMRMLMRASPDCGQCAFPMRITAKGPHRACPPLPPRARDARGHPCVEPCQQLASAVSWVALPEMPVVPREYSLKHVDVVGTAPRCVPFARIQDHLGLDPKVLEGAVEPLRLSNGIAGVVFASKDQCGGARCGYRSPASYAQRPPHALTACRITTDHPPADPRFRIPIAD